MSIKILIGTGDPDLAAQLRTQAAELPDVEVVGVDKTSQEVLAGVIAQQDLDVMLVDDELGPQSGLELVREVVMRRPHVGAVLLTARVDEQVLAQALEAGARGVLSKQAGLEELNARVVSVAEWSRGMRRWIGAGPAEQLGGRRGRVLALAGAKGGTGVTTVAIQLGLAAAATGRSVCLVDMDLQCGDVPTYLDLVHRRSIADLVEVAGEITGAMLADALFVHEAGLHVLLAPNEGERAEDVTSNAARQILGTLRSRYEVVIIDCGAFTTEGSLTAIELADQAVLTVTPDLPCLRAAKRVAQLWSRLQARREEEISVLLTRQSRRNEIQPEFAARILGLPLLQTTVPPSFRALEKAINNGQLGRVDDEAFRRSVTLLGGELGILPLDGASLPGIRRRTKAEAK